MLIAECRLKRTSLLSVCMYIYIYIYILIIYYDARGASIATIRLLNRLQAAYRQNTT